MRTTFALGLAVSIAAFVAGCSAAPVAQPLAVGPDTYTVSSRTSIGGTDAAREAAVKAAGQQCARLSKKLRLVSSDTNFGSNEDQGVVNLKFRCLAADDPELHRPSVQPSPDVVIKTTHTAR
jgi:hypothetical protein